MWKTRQNFFFVFVNIIHDSDVHLSVHGKKQKKNRFYEAAKFKNGINFVGNNE
jgi:hypothetical protein